METNSNPKKEAGTDKQEVFTYKQGQYPPRRRKDTTPKIDPHLAVELVYAELKRVEAYTKRIEDAAVRKVQMDEKSIQNAVNSLKSPLSEYNKVLSDYRQQADSMKKGGYVDKRYNLYSILAVVVSLLFSCLLCYLWTDAAKDRDRYKQYYEYLHQHREQQRVNKG